MKNIIYSPELGLLIFRLVIGFTMAFSHGLGKLPPPEMLVSGIAAMGFPAPIVFAWCAGLSEFFGGICIGVGLFTRAAAFFMGFTMSVAFFIVHGADAFAKKRNGFIIFSFMPFTFLSRRREVFVRSNLSQGLGGRTIKFVFIESSSSSPLCISLGGRISEPSKQVDSYTISFIKFEKGVLELSIEAPK